MNIQPIDLPGFLRAVTWPVLAAIVCILFRLNIWTPPALQATSLPLDSGSDCDKYIRPLMRPSTRAQMTIRSREPHKFYGV